MTSLCSLRARIDKRKSGKLQTSVKHSILLEKEEPFPSMLLDRIQRIGLLGLLNDSYSYTLRASRGLLFFTNRERGQVLMMCPLKRQKIKK